MTSHFNIRKKIVVFLRILSHSKVKESVLTDQVLSFVQ